MNVWFFFSARPSIYGWFQCYYSNANWLKSVCHVSWAENIYLIASNLNILKYHESNLEKPQVLKSYPKIKTQNTIYIIVWACPKPSLNTEATTSLSTWLFSDVSLVAHCFSQYLFHKKSVLVIPSALFCISIAVAQLASPRLSHSILLLPFTHPCTHYGTNDAELLQDLNCSC